MTTRRGKVAEVDAGPAGDVTDETANGEGQHEGHDLAVQAHDLVVQAHHVVPQAPDVAAPAEDNSAVEIPDDFYVALAPLTLDLVAQHLERIGINFTRLPTSIRAAWPTFVLTISIGTEHMLSARATLRQSYPAMSHTAVVARCNWWNSRLIFLKASAIVLIGQEKATDDTADESEPALLPFTQVNLDLDLPLPVGVAPVQLQSLFRSIVQNVSSFELRADLGTLASQSTWQ
jgi:hypothetical protein